MNEAGRVAGKRQNQRSADLSKRDFFLREPTRSQEVNAKKRRRLTPLEMTGLGWALQTKGTDKGVCATARKFRPFKTKGAAPEESEAAPEIVAEL
jgi:hypothetical protein